MQSLTLSSTNGNGERIGRVRGGKIVGRHKDRLIGKEKAVHASKEKQEFKSVLPKGRQVFSHLQESRAPLHVMVTWDEKHHHLNVRFLKFSSLFCKEVNHLGRMGERFVILFGFCH